MVSICPLLSTMFSAPEQVPALVERVGFSPSTACSITEVAGTGEKVGAWLGVAEGSGVGTGVCEDSEPEQAASTATIKTMKKKITLGFIWSYVPLFLCSLNEYFPNDASSLIAAEYPAWDCIRFNTAI